MIKKLFDDYLGGLKGIDEFFELALYLIIPSFLATPAIGIPIGLAVYFVMHLDEN